MHDRLMGEGQFVREVHTERSYSSVYSKCGSAISQTLQIFKHLLVSYALICASISLSQRHKYVHNFFNMSFDDI